MLSVIIPTRNAASGLADCLASLNSEGKNGLIHEILIVDGGSTDATESIAANSAAKLIRSEPGRARQMHAGALQAEGDWLLFLHADVILESGWEKEARDLLARHRRDAQRDVQCAAAFRFALRHASYKARLLEHLVAWRCRWLGLAYGDQGLLLPRSFYFALGGFAMLEFMEDVEMMRRIGRRRLILLHSKAQSDAQRYQNDGFLARCTRNGMLVVLYLLGVPAGRLAAFYAGGSGGRPPAQ